jgi:hypothetical protein
MYHAGALPDPGCLLACWNNLSTRPPAVTSVRLRAMCAAKP